LLTSSPVCTQTDLAADVPVIRVECSLVAADAIPAVAGDNFRRLIGQLSLILCLFLAAFTAELQPALA
jgi:hypothetical protein